ncbi:MAG: QueT transporter family protein [Clostridia bacterium]|nr:QueT transporter family protein [Clostridia bacterium]
MKRISTRFLVQAAVIGSLYAALTLLLAPFSFGYMQVRVSEALTVLAFFTPAAVPGLFIGCILANIIGGFGIIDIVFGSLATLTAAYLTYKMKNRLLAPLPPVIINGLIVGYIISFYLDIPLWLGIVSVTAGEAIACYGLGLPLLLLLEKHKKNLFRI